MKTLLLSTLLSATLLAQEGAIDPERAANFVPLNESAVRNLGIETSEVAEVTFETSLFAIGRIEEVPARQSVVSTRIPGRVVSLDAYVGDRVEEGQVVARIESRQPGSPPPTIKIVAPRSGLVIDSQVQLGEPVEPGAELMEISDRSIVWAVAKIPEQEAADIKVGTVARMHLPAIGDQTFTATLKRFGVSADRETSSLEGIFELENTGGILRPGMRVEFSLVTSLREEVLAIPRSAIQGSLTERVVFVKDFDIDNSFLRSPVTLGEQNDQYAEVISGLFPGDEVVTTGSYALSFAGSGSGMSLKEALDAAHGHEHNEDGTDKTTEEMETEEQHHHGDHTEATSSSALILAWAITATLLAVVFAQLFWNQIRKRSHSDA